jgi:hypothetical protein
VAIALCIILLVSTALLLGNEFSIAYFIHPALSRSDHLRFLPAIQIFANLFGRVMPVWMAATFILHIALLWMTWQWPADHTILFVLAAVLWLVIIVFSLLGPVPINDRVKGWRLEELPGDWAGQRRKWDFLNGVRVVLIGLAFLALLLGFKCLN